MSKTGTTRQHPVAGPREASFATDQLALASFLVSRGYRPALTVAPTGKVLFHFPASQGLGDDVTAFLQGSATVDPARFDAARIQLRKQMDTMLTRVR